jgi:hypothetical protein
MNDHTVSFVIPEGVSRIQILEEVQMLILNPLGEPIIDPEHLAWWKEEERFSSQQATSKKLCIDGNVPDGTNHTREEQEAFLGEEFTMANLEDLAVAFCLHWVATGEPLFGWIDKAEGWSYAIRAAGGSLGFLKGQLSALSIHDGFDSAAVGVSARVSSE